MLTTPPFSRAPLLLRKHRVALAAVVVSALVLGMVIALSPLFLSAAASAALRLEIGGLCDSRTAGSMRPVSFGSGGSRFYGVSEGNREKLRDAIGDRERFLDPRATVVSRSLTVAVNGEAENAFPLLFMHRSGFRDKAPLVAGGKGGGVWIDEFASELYGVEVGDQLDYEFVVVFDDPDQVPAVPGDTPDLVVTSSTTVTGITEDMTKLRTQDYWCGIDEWIGFTPTGDRSTPVGLVDLDLFQGNVVDGIDVGLFLIRDEFWELPVETSDLTLDEAGDVLDSFAAIGQSVVNDPESTIRSDLGSIRDRAGAIHDALATSIRPLALTVVVLAFGLVAGAAVYWVDRRADELRALSAFGVGPLALGFKAGLEMFIPTVVGLAVGTLVSSPVASWVGPDRAIEQSAREEGWLLVILGLAISALLVALVAAIRARRLLEPTSRTQRSGYWRPVLLVGFAVLAFAVRRGLGDQAVTFDDGDLVGSVDPLVVLYPLLVFVGVALLLAESVLGLAKFLKRRLKGHSSFLAVRRLLSKPSHVLLLVVGALIPVATLLYSTTLTRSTEQAITAKGQVFIGSDVRVPVFDFEQLPEELTGLSTYVRRAERVEFDRTEIDLLVVDDATFEAGAFWHDSFADLSLPGLLEVLAGGGEQLSAVVANGTLPGESGIVDLGRVEIPIDVVATARSFPGSRGSRPLVVVGARAYDRYISGLDEPPNTPDGTLKYLWVKDRTGEEVERALSGADVGFAFTTTIDEALDLTKFQAIIWTFDFLELYAALSGVIVIAAIFLYSDTRQRARNLSYALALRMGLTRREHFVAGLIEIGTVTVSAAVVGIVTAMLVSGSVYQALDPLPATPPPPAWSWDFDVVAILIIAAAAVSAIASLIAQRTADNADVSELLRHGG